MKKSWPLLSIVGPTATGKTDLALAVAREALGNPLITGIDLISVDSRQVYQGLEIVSGADIPSGFLPTRADDLPYPFFQQDALCLHGVSLLQPHEEWSVAHFQKLAHSILLQCLEHHRLPILVGGTGLYHRHLFTNDPQLQIGPNEELRRQAESLEVDELQMWLGNLAPKTLAAMNESDRQNPRRLLRALEKTVAQLETVASRSVSSAPFGLNSDGHELDHLESQFERRVLALTDELEVLTKRIERRVQARLGDGVIEEVKKAMKLGEYHSSLPALTATGVREVVDFLEGELSLEQLHEAWSRREIQYAKRQLTWWKKEPQVEWFSVDSPDWPQPAVSQAISWLSQFS